MSARATFFDTKRVHAMLSAFDEACRILTSDADRAALARAITELGEAGETDRERLRDMAIVRVRAATAAAREGGAT